MHEIRAALPPELVPEVVSLAHKIGIARVNVSEVFVHGPDLPWKQVSVETSTPTAKAFVDALLNSPSLLHIPYTLTSREVRAIVNGETPELITQPLCEPFPDVIQDLWQLSHVTLSYLARAAAGAIILASGIIENNPISIVLAALFLPFLSQVLAVSFGAWNRDWNLTRHGAKALLCSLAITYLGGLIVAAVMGGPIRFDDFRSPLPSLAISAIIGITAGLSLADDTGRRYLIGVAAAVQLAIFPVWLGAATVIGLPPLTDLKEYLVTFLINLAAIAIGATISYAALHFKAGLRPPR